MSNLQHMYGLTLPTSNYVSSVTESFPTNNRPYKIETSIGDRNLREYLPTNINVTNGSVTDNYVEFILDGSDAEFVDLSSIYVEMKMKIVNEDGSSLDDSKNVSLVDGVANRIFTRSSVYLNSIAVESNSSYGICGVLKNYMNLSKESIDGVGRNMYYKSLDSKIYDLFVADAFKKENITRDETDIIADCKKVVHMICPLQLDISTANIYLLNAVNIRIRLDLASPSMIINTYDTEKYKYRLSSVKLFATKLLPLPSALLSLQKHLATNNSSIEYIYERPLVKSFIFSSGHNTLTMDNIFNGIVPSQLFSCIIAQDADNGSYSRNACYFTDCNLSNVSLEVNGNPVSKMECEFPSEIAQLFYNTITNLPSTHHLFTVNNFKKGRTVLAWNLNPTQAEDVMSLERSGNIRMRLQCSKPTRENYVVYVIGIISGIFEIDSNRRVSTNNKM